MYVGYMVLCHFHNWTKNYQGNFGRCAAEIANAPQCIYCYQMKPDFTCYILFDNLDAIV